MLASRPDLDRIDLVHHADPGDRAAMFDALDPLLAKPAKPKDREIGLLIDFLHALTDPATTDLRHTVPGRVPSGLPLRD